MSDDSLSDFYPTSQSSNTKPLSIDTAISSNSDSQASSPRTLKHTTRKIRLPDLPPTPPTHSRQSSAGSTALVAESIPVQKTRVKTPSRPLTPSTPPNKHSPPTPDVTPPKAAWSGIMSLRPPPSGRYPSSQADSFKTAPEFPDSSDDEVSTVRPTLPSARPSETDVPTLSDSEGYIGLGLGLETDDRTASSRIAIDPSFQARNDFGTFDGEWGSSQGELTEVEKEWDDNLMRNVTVRRRPNQNRISYIYDDSPIASRDVIDDNLIAPTNATNFLRELPVDTMIAKPWDDAVRGTPKHSTEDSADWTRMAKPDFPSSPDLRRFSAMSNRSNTSTRIEAMVVDTTPQGRKTLRHTKKYNGLRALSYEMHPASVSRNVSASSNDTSHRLAHTTKIRDLRHHSLGSTITSSTFSNKQSRKEVLRNGGIPVIVVPERASSKKTSRTPSLRSTSSRHTAHKRSVSLSSAPISNSSRSHEKGYFDLPTKRVHRMSETASTSGSQRTIDFPPTIPARRSSLSAPTSQTGSKVGSRSGSLTTESLKAHNLLHANAVKEALKSQDVRSAGSLNGPQNPSRQGDQTRDPRKLTAHQTPFSQHSYETVGTTAEISEAMAVSLFPHQNKSVLRIQHSRPNTSSVETTSRTVQLSEDSKTSPDESVAAKVNLPETPPEATEADGQDDSPFRNPRAPPLPPAIKFIPPTPAALTPSVETDRQLGHGIEISPVDTRPKRGFSLRRALTGRRYSESIIPRTLSLKRNPQNSTAVSHSTQTSKATANPDPLYPSVSDQPKDVSKLHPFWRPARFWDDLEDEEYSSDEDYDDGIVNAYPQIDNRPRPPKRSFSGQLKRTFAILPIKDDPYYAPEWTERRVVRRTGSGSLRVVRHRGSIETLKRARQHMEKYGGTGYDGKGRAKGNDLVEGWKGLSRRLSERRKEKRQGRLRELIGSPTDLVNDRDNVLRNRRYESVK